MSESRETPSLHDLRENVLLYTSQTTEGLLPRDTSQSGGKEFHSYVAELIIDSVRANKNSNPQHLMLSGEPSSGKTTELKRIATALLEVEGVTEEVLPVYSELQYAIAGSNKSLWSNFISGSADPQLASIAESASIKSLKDLAEKQGKKLILFIDTLDILLLDDGKDIAKNWAEFLSMATEHSVHVIWTCRPFEWKFFEKEFPEEMKSITKKTSLPNLSIHELNKFPLAEESLGESDEEFTKCWNHWSIRFQSKMPLFAQRFKLSETDFRHLHQSFISILEKEFHTMFSASIARSNPLTLLQNQLPTSLYYSWIWKTIIETIDTHYSVDVNAGTRFRFIFEDWLSSNVINQTKRHTVPKLRLRFSIGDLYELVTKSDENLIRADDLDHLLNVAESFGLIEKFGTWFEFSHQLLFEEALFSSSRRNNNNRHTNFPSIQIRSLREDVNASESEIDENYDSIIHWTGAFYAYHPEARNTSSILGVQWRQWVDYASRHLNKIETSYQSPMDELGEKARILRNFMDGSTKRALMLNGSPGTGKTYFCYHFLERHLVEDRESMNWRYVTLSEPLVDHFRSGWDKYLDLPNVDDRVIRRAEQSQKPRLIQSATSVFAILRKFHPKLVQGPKVVSEKNRVLAEITNGTQIGLLTFPKFKQLFNRFCGKIKGSFNRPGIGDAWRDYLQCWHDPVTGARIKSPKDGPKRMSLGGNDMKVFNRFIKEDLKHWKTYDQACFEASRKFLNLDAKDRHRFQHDLLMIDEIQDMTAPILTFLLLLSSKNTTNKRILLTGDRLQTVNRSGFDWNRITKTCSTALSSAEFKISMDFETRLLDSIDIYSDEILPVHTLRTPWRSAPSITTFNDHLRQGFGKRHKINLPDYTVEATPNLSSEAMEREDYAQVTLVVCEEDSDFDACIELLKSIEIELGERANTALLTPYLHTVPQLENFVSFTSYNAETVKGLEFDNVVIAQPYELLYNEALSSLGFQPGKSAPMEDTRLVSWVNSTSNEAKANLEKFVSDLYDNIRTRMNVMFSRAKFRMVVLLRQELGEGWLVDDRDPDNPTLIIDYPNPSPHFESDQIKLQKLVQPTKQELLDALHLPVGVGDVSPGSRVERAIDEEKNSAGESYQNIKNLWRSYVQNLSSISESTVRSASLLGGLIDNQFRRNKNSLPPVLYALRPATLDHKQVETYAINFKQDYDYLYERFILTLQTSFQRLSRKEKTVLRCPILSFADLSSHLAEVLNEILKEAADPVVYAKHPRLLLVLIKEVLGIDLSLEGVVSIKHIEPIRGLRILLDPQMVEQNNGSVIQLKEKKLAEFEQYADDVNYENPNMDLTLSWHMDDQGLNVHNRILGHMWLSLQHEHAGAIVDKTAMAMEGHKMNLDLVTLSEESSFWKIVLKEQRILPEDGSITSLLARKVMWKLYDAALESNQAPSGNILWDRKITHRIAAGCVLGAYPAAVDEHATFDCILLKWFLSLESLNYSQLLNKAELTFDLHSFLSQQPNKAVCELLILLTYGEVEALNWEGIHDNRSTFIIWDSDTNEVTELISFWSEHIVNTFGFSQSFIGPNSNHSINETKFYDVVLFENELLLFNPKIHYLANMNPNFTYPIAKKYLDKFAESSKHFFQSSKTKGVMMKKIAATWQQFVLPYDRTEKPRASTMSDTTTFGKLFNWNERVYSRDIIQNILPLLSIIESSFEINYIGDEGLILPNRKETDLTSIKDSFIRLPLLDGWFRHTFKALLEIKIESDKDYDHAHKLVNVYLELTSPVTQIPWRNNRRNKLDRIARDPLVREHIYYWTKLIQMLDLKPETVPRRVRKDYCPHFLLPLQYEVDKKFLKHPSDDREQLIYNSIESIRLNLRSKRANWNERKVYLSRALTYLAAPPPPKKNRTPQSLSLRRQDRYSKQGPENPFLSEHWENKTSKIQDWKTNPTRALAIQCLTAGGKHEHTLDWSVFLMLSTISHTEDRLESVRDCEIRLSSINLTLSEQLLGESNQKPNLDTDTVHLRILEFFRMIEEPYLEIGSRFTDNLLNDAVKAGKFRHSGNHPIIVPHLNLDANYARWLYLQAMKLDFTCHKPFNMLMEGYEKNFQWDD